MAKVAAKKSDGKRGPPRGRPEGRKKSGMFKSGVKKVDKRSTPGRGSSNRGRPRQDQHQKGGRFRGGAKRVGGRGPPGRWSGSKGKPGQEQQQKERHWTRKIESKIMKKRPRTGKAKTVKELQDRKRRNIMADFVGRLENDAKTDHRCWNRAVSENLLAMKEQKEIKRSKKLKETAQFENLVESKVVEQAIAGVRKFSEQGKKGEKKDKALLNQDSDDDGFIFMQVGLVKLPKVISGRQHLVRPIRMKVPLPHCLVTDDMEVVLITRDLEKGIRPDHDETYQHYLDLLRQHDVLQLVNHLIPFRQLKVEYKEYEAKRHLANRTDVLLCDDTIMRMIPKFLGKHFYKKKRIPVQINLKAEDLAKEFHRALSVSLLNFTLEGNSSIMKVGRLGQSDEEIMDNIKAAVLKLAISGPGNWGNVRSLGLKLEKSHSIPFYVNLAPQNDGRTINLKPLRSMEPVSGLLTNFPGKVATVYHDGQVTVTNQEDTGYRVPREDFRRYSKPAWKQTVAESPSAQLVVQAEEPMEETEEPETYTTPTVSQKNKNNDKQVKGKKKLKKKASKSEAKEPAKKKKKTLEEEEEEEEKALEAAEQAYLHRLREQEASEPGEAEEQEQQEDGETSDVDAWANDSDGSE